MLSALPACKMIGVKSWGVGKSVPAQVAQIFGVPWPQSTGSTVSGQTDIVCIGPAEWLLIAHGSANPDVLHTLEEALRDTSFRATDMSSALVRIRLTGPDSRGILSKGCSLDLDPEMFGVDRSARTHLAGMAVIVRCIKPAVFECIVSRSYLAYLLAWLEDASLEFGTGGGD